ncbi:MAG TPA: hypothetical protein VLU25_00540 [Acidobacteriota bacterium]|nr:hypothetical protein [Acidobacteriota bacterium]
MQLALVLDGQGSEMSVGTEVAADSGILQQTLKNLEMTLSGQHDLNVRSAVKMPASATARKREDFTALEPSKRA